MWKTLVIFLLGLCHLAFAMVQGPSQDSQVCYTCDNNRNGHRLECGPGEDIVFISGEVSVGRFGKPPGEDGEDGTGQQSHCNCPPPSNRINCTVQLDPVLMGDVCNGRRTCNLPMLEYSYSKSGPGTCEKNDEGQLKALVSAIKYRCDMDGKQGGDEPDMMPIVIASVVSALVVLLIVVIVFAIVYMYKRKKKSKMYIYRNRSMHDPVYRGNEGFDEGDYHTIPADYGRIVPRDTLYHKYYTIGDNDKKETDLKVDDDYDKANHGGVAQQNNTSSNEYDDSSRNGRIRKGTYNKIDLNRIRDNITVGDYNHTNKTNNDYNHLGDADENKAPAINNYNRLKLNGELKTPVVDDYNKLDTTDEVHNQNKNDYNHLDAKVETQTPVIGDYNKLDIKGVEAYDDAFTPPSDDSEEETTTDKLSAAFDDISNDKTDGHDGAITTTDTESEDESNVNKETINRKVSYEVPENVKSSSFDNTDKASSEDEHSDVENVNESKSVTFELPSKKVDTEHNELSSSIGGECASLDSYESMPDEDNFNESTNELSEVGTEPSHRASYEIPDIKVTDTDDTSDIEM